MIASVASAIIFFCAADSAFAAKDFNIRNSGTYHFTVKGATGNVGIGSFAPEQKLDVQGTVHVTGNVGIGTLTPQGGLVVTNGNVGIGTWETTTAPLVVNGYIAAESSDTITSNPKQVKSTLGWKIGLWSNSFAIGVANFTTAMRGGNWLSVFENGNPANNATATVPDSNASVSIGGGGMGIFRSNIGISTIAPRNQLSVNGAVGIGTNNSGFVSTTAPSGGLIVEGNVGVGSLSPGTPLDIQGTARMTAFTLSTGAAAGYVLQTNSVGVGTWVAAGTLSNSSQWATNGSDIYFSGGNIGLGTSTPLAALAITNGTLGIGTWSTQGYSVWVTSSIRVNGSGVTNGAMLSLGGNGEFTIDGPSVPGGRFAVKNSSGNVGIGSYAPGNKLSVVGPVGIGTISYSPYSFTAAPNGGMIIEGNVGLATTNPQAGLVSMNNVGIGTWTAGGGRLIVQGGNVGVGTVNPGAPLDVQGTVRSTGITMTTGAAAGYVLQTDSVGVGTWVDAATVINAGTPGGNSNAVQYNNAGAFAGADNNFFFDGTNVGIGTTMTGSSTAKLAVMGGNVGVGTIIPLAVLEAAGGSTNVFGIRNRGATAGEGIWTFGFASAISGDLTLQSKWDKFKIYVDTDSNQAADAFEIYHNGTPSGSPVQVFGVYEGNVGVATSTPQGALVVTNGNVGIGTWAPAAVLQVGTGTQGSGVSVDANGNVGIGTNLTTLSALTVLNGNMGIGTWIPAAGLNIAGQRSILFNTIGTSADVLSSVGGAVSASGGQIVMVGGGGGGANTYGHRLREFDTGNIGQVGLDLIIDRKAGGSWAYNTVVFQGSSGNVGIGTFNPYSLLAVAGNASIGAGYAASAPPANGFLVQGNVGLGSTAPGQPLDIQGTARMTAFTLSTGAASGYVLQTNSVGVGTWVDSATLAGGNSGWSASGGNVYTTTGSNNVGIGTSTPQGRFVVTNGNVGIGTWESDGARLTVLGGNVGIGTRTPGNILDIYGNSNSIVTGIARIQNTYDNTTVPALEMLAPNLTPSHQFYFSLGRDPSTYNRASWMYNYVGNNSSANNMGFGFYGAGQLLTLEGSGNVGVGTTTPQGAFVVTNGNVGIGTWETGAGKFIVQGGNVGIGTAFPQAGLVVMNGNVGIGTFTATSASGGTYALNVWNNVRISNSPGSATALSVGGSGDFAIDNPNFVGGRFIVKANTGNVGLGTSTPQGTLVVASGNVGIGTWTAAGGNLIINGGGNVGVGSVWPGVPLDVQGTVRSTGFTLSTGAASGYVLQTNSVGVGTWVDSATLAGGNSGWSASGGNVYTTTGSNNVGIGTSTPQGGFVVTNGNVGVGTWAPVWRLDIEGGSDTTMLGIQNQLTGARIRFKATSGAIKYVGTDSSGNFSVLANNASTNLFTVAESGNVGITTSTPQAALAIVNGNVGIGTWTADGGRLIVRGGNVGIGTVNANHEVEVVGSVAASGQFLADNSGGFSFQTSTTSGLFQPAGGDIRLQSSGSVMYRAAGAVNYLLNQLAVGPVGVVPGSKLGVVGNIGVGTASSSTYFLTAAPNGGMILEGNLGIGTLTADNGRLIVQGGNVGIGTVTPGVLLDVQGTARMTAFTLSTGAASGYVLQTNSVGVGTWVDAATLAGGNSGWSASGGNVYTTTGSNNVGIGTSTPQGGLVVTNGNMGIGTWETGGGKFIVQGGNVGIGTWAPASALEVVGNVGVGTTNMAQQVSVSGGRALFGWGQAGGSVSAAFMKASTAYGIAAYVNGNTTPATYVDTAGNFGVGTTTPQGGFVVTSGNVGIGTWAPRAALDVQGTLSTSYFGGNVGIGTWLPAAPLQVEQTVNTPITGFSIKGAVDNVAVSLTNTSTGGVTWWLDSTGGGSTWGRGKLSFGSGTAWGVPPVMTLLSTYKVGIGTTNPQAGLAIASGNVGIGTWTADGGRLIVEGGGNVGIGSAWPGVPLDVQGTVRSTGFTLSTGAASGYVLQTNSVGVGTWVAPSTILSAGASPGGGGTELQYRGGVSTLAAVTGSGVDVNGNVGIGSSGPGQKLDVQGSVRISGNVGIGSYAPEYGLVVASGGAKIVGSGGYFTVTGTNVGVGTSAPGTALDVSGTGRFSTAVSTPALSNLTSNGFVKTSGGTGTLSVDTSTYVTGTTISSGYLAQATSSSNVTNSVMYGAGNNIGIGSTVPGQTLDIQGTARMTAFALSTGAASGYVLQTNSVGVGTWVDPSTIVSGGGGTPSGNSNAVQYNSSGSFAGADNNFAFDGTNVGIGTTLTGATGKLNVMGGNVGIGTVNPQALLSVVSGNVGIGTWAAGGGRLIVQGGNVGIGSAWPGKALDINGDLRVSSRIWLPSVGGVIDFGSSSPSFISGFSGSSGYINMRAGNNVPSMLALLASGNVGMGTTDPQTGLSIMSGNVGIGTWTATGGVLIIPPGLGNVGIGSTFPGAQLDVQGTARLTGLALTPSSTTNITAGGGITVTSGIMRIQGSGGAVTVTANPRIAAGDADGQIVILQGMSNANTVTIANGNGLQLNGGVSFTFNQYSTMTLMYDAADGVWVETSRTTP